MGYLRCETGLVPAPMAERIRSILQLRGPFVEVAEAGHHLMLDQPLQLVATSSRREGAKRSLGLRNPVRAWVEPRCVPGDYAAHLATAM